MKKKTLVQLRHIADRIPKQCPCEIAAFLYSICEEWEFAFLNGCLVFIADGNPVLVMPLTTIYGTLRTGNTLYILCNNGALHYSTEKHTSIGFLSSTIRTKTSLTVCSTDADQTNLLSDVKMISHPIDPIILLQ